MKIRALLAGVLALLAAGAWRAEAADEPADAWVVPSVDKLPDTPWGRAVRAGRALTVDTPALIGPGAPDPADRFVGNTLSCGNCHLEAGTKRSGLPFVGVFADFPQYRAREGEVGSLEDRINGCMTRSLNGRPLPLDSPAMKAIVAYIKFLSDGVPIGKTIAGRGAGALPLLSRAADPVRGQAVYAGVCATCHGADGQGRRAGGRTTIPPLWGEDSFNDGAGMNRLIGAASFIHNNMPNGTTWKQPVLSPEEAWDVAAYVLAQPRPHKPGIENDFPVRAEKPADTGYGPYSDGFDKTQHTLGPFGPIKAAAQAQAQAAAAKPAN
jgi:thiosulfate dehydrogenase